MNKVFIDTNIFLRFLLEDHKDQRDEAASILRQGEQNESILSTSTLVIFEVHWVLSRFYKVNKPDLALLMSKILKMDFIEIKERDLLKKALVLFNQNNITFQDCYNCLTALSEGAIYLATFDKKLKKLFDFLKE